MNPRNDGLVERFNPGYLVVNGHQIEQLTRQDPRPRFDSAEFVDLGERRIVPGFVPRPTCSFLKEGVYHDMFNFKMRTKLFSVSLCLCGCLYLANTAAAADKWLSIQTKNFQLVGNASESDIRRVGRTFEEFRSALASVFPKMDQASTVPTTIVIFKNDESFQPFKPLIKGQPANVVAYFQGGEDVNYIAVTAAMTSPASVFHEYVHFLLRDNVGGLPLWISEGLAESYSTFDLSGKNEYTLGRAPEPHVATFMTGPRFIPIKQLLTIDEQSPEYSGHSKQGMFYAESWAMTHYFVFGAEAKRRNQFSQLLTLLAKGTSFEDSFAEAFQTDYGTVEDEVREYIRKRNSWPQTKVMTKDTLQVDVRSIKTTTLTDAESEFYAGDLLLHLNRLSDAEPHLINATAKTPAPAQAQSALAVLRVRQKKYGDALSILKKAVETDAQNPIVNFYYAYVLERAEGDAAAQLTEAPAERYAMMRTFAKKTIDLAPRNVEAYAMLARIDMNSDDNLPEAETTLKKAIAIAPGRDDLQMLLAQTYMRQNRVDDARGVLSLIARNATNPDVRRRATTMLDQSEKTFSFADITPSIEKEIANDLAKERAAQQAAQPPASPTPANRKPAETLLEALTPIRPTVEGEQITGLLTNLECADGLTLTVRSDQTSMRLHSADPNKIQFLSYTSAVSNNIQCGPRNPGTPVTVTYRPVSAGTGDPLVVEFLEKIDKK
jgi:tetratricopeptide (TPR) repeat protein